VLPWVWTVAPALEAQPLVWIAPLSAAVIVGLVVAWIVSGIGERRWAKVRADPAMMRNGFALYDAYGGVVPDSVPAQDLWDALDTPGGVTSSPVHVQIMDALRAGRTATPPEDA